jgi:hypothetical protein
MANLGNTTRPAYVYDAETDTWLPIGVGAHTHDQIPASIVDAKGDLIVGTAADTVQKRTVGADGSYLVADSTQTTGLNWAGPSNIAGKNFIINGGFDIWQRGTSVAAGNGVYTADRWATFTDSESRTVSRQVTGDSTNLPNIQYCARMQRPASNTGTGRVIIGSGLETANSIPLINKPVTLSFYARAGANFSSSANGLFVYLQYGTGTDQNVFVGFTGNTNLLVETKTLTTTWQRFSITATFPTNANQIGYQFGYTPTGTAGAADYFEITGVQLEIGSLATPFSRAAGNIQGELATCQRYYYRQNANAGSSKATFGVGSAYNSGRVDANVQFPVSMRIIPTSIDFPTVGTFFRAEDNNTNGAALTSLTMSGTQTTTDNATLVGLSSTLTTYRPTNIVGVGTGAYIGYSSEL